MNEHIFSLPVLSTLSPSLSQRQIGELPVLVIAHPKVRAAVTLQGAHLIDWQPVDEQPVIWVSEKTLWQSNKAIRGGIPVCWPWFGPAGEPAHGFARNLPWKLATHEENEQGVMLTLILESDEQTQKLWPHDFTLFVRFRLGETCEIELEAHGDFETTAALHSYFNVADNNAVTVSGLGSPYIDKVLDGACGQLAEGKQTYAQRVDRIHPQPEACSLLNDKAGHRIIEIHHHNNSDVVTWNPGAELSHSMADMTDDGYKTMVCVETAHVTQPMVSSPEQPARMAVTFRIHKQ